MDPGDIGVALPTLSRKILEYHINRKKEELALQMVRDIDDYHFSWYSDEDCVVVGFEEEVETWADTVRGESSDIMQ